MILLLYESLGSVLLCPSAPYTKHRLSLHFLGHCLEGREQDDCCLDTVLLPHGGTECWRPGILWERGYSSGWSSQPLSCNLECALYESISCLITGNCKKNTCPNLGSPENIPRGRTSVQVLGLGGGSRKLYEIEDSAMGMRKTQHAAFMS